MNGTRAVIIMIIVFVVAIVLGFMMGSKRVSELQRKLDVREKEYATEKATLEGNLVKAKVQKELSVCKWELVEVRTSASRRDFGKATETLSAAREAFSKAVSVSRSDYFTQKLSPVQASFDEMKAGLDKNDVKVVGKIEEVIAQLETIISE